MKFIVWCILEVISETIESLKLIKDFYLLFMSDFLTAQQIANVVLAALQGNGIEVKNDAGNPLTMTVPSGLVIMNTSGQAVPVNFNQQLDETNDKVQASLKASATNIGLDTYFNGALAATAVAVKTSAANLYGWDFMSLAAAANIFVQFFDLPVASVTLGTTTPRISVGIPNGQGKVLSPVTPTTYVNAITVACTATATGSGAPGGNCIANIFLK